MPYINTKKPLATTPTDSEILAWIKLPATKEQGFKCLMDMHQEKLYQMVYRMTANHSDTDDLLQDIFVKAWRHVDGFAGKSSLYTWLYRIAVNETLNFLSRQKKHQHVGFDHLPEEKASSDGPSSDQIELLLSKALQLLPEKQRIVFNLRYFEEMDYRQMSELLDTSAGALKASYHHAIQKIESYLRQQNAI